MKKYGIVDSAIKLGTVYTSLETGITDGQNCLTYVDGNAVVCDAQLLAFTIVFI